jgi:hypothetical protein
VPTKEKYTMAYIIKCDKCGRFESSAIPITNLPPEFFVLSLDSENILDSEPAWKITKLICRDCVKKLFDWIENK